MERMVLKDQKAKKKRNLKSFHEQIHIKINRTKHNIWIENVTFKISCTGEQQGQKYTFSSHCISFNTNIP